MHSLRLSDDRVGRKRAGNIFYSCKNSKTSYGAFVMSVAIWLQVIILNLFDESVFFFQSIGYINSTVNIVGSKNKPTVPEVVSDINIA